MGYPDSSRAETDSRVAQVYRLLLNGLRRRDIIQYIANKTDWNVTVRTIDNYIKKATDEIAAVNDAEKLASRGMALKRLDDLYFKLMQKKDYKGCLSVQREINEVTGLKTLKHEMSTNGPAAIDELMTYLKEHPPED